MHVGPRNKNFVADRYHLLEAYGVIVRSFAPRSLGSLQNLTRGDRPTSDQQELLNIGLRSCAETGTLTCIRLALALGADPRSKTDERTTDRMGPLESVSWPRGGARIVMKTGLLATTVQPRRRNRSPPFFDRSMGVFEGAVRHAPFSFADSYTCLRLVTLLGAGADPNEDFVFPWVAESWNQTGTTAMLSFGADPGKIHSTGESALLAVFRNPASFENRAGMAPMIKLLLRVKPNPNGQDAIGLTPLMWAATFHQPEAVTALLATGADPHYSRQRRKDRAGPRLRG